MENNNVHNIPAAGASANTPTRKRALVSSFLGWMFDGYETSTLILVGIAAMTSLMTNASPAEVRQAVGAALSATLLGWALGGMVGSVIADYIGRRRMLMIAIAGYSILTGFSALSATADTLIFLRFLTGLFLGSEWSTGTALVAETWPVDKRAKALGVMQSGFGFGFLLASVAWLFLAPLLGEYAWRWMFAAGILPAFILLFIRRSMPESEMWQKSRDRQLLTNNSKSWFKGDNFTVFSMLSDSQSRKKAFLTLLMSGVTVAVFYGISSLLYPYVSNLAALEGLKPQQWATISAIVFNIGALFGYISAGYIAEAIGRKTYMFWTFIGAMITTPLVFYFCTSITSIVIGSAVLGFFTLGSFSWMPIYLPELFGTRIRSTATGLVFNIGRLVAFTVPVWASTLANKSGGPLMPAFWLATLFLISLSALHFLPETKGKGLPE